MSRVEIKNLRKAFDDHVVIPDLSLDIRDASFTVLVGPSGCGKSTLLRSIAGLEDVTAGEIRIGGRDVTSIPGSKRGIAMVFQSYALYPHMNVRDNMSFALKLAGMDASAIRTRVHKAAEILDMQDLLDRKPGQLSGGQRQRVAIGRAIVREPDVFLFDEPLSNLDAALRAQMRVELARLHQQLGVTMIYVTHDQVEAMTLADQIVVMRAGVIQQQGGPMDLYSRPVNAFVASFIGSPAINFVEATHFPGGSEGVLGVRPEHIAVSRESGIWPGQVTLVERLGADTVIYVNTIPGDLTVRLQGEASFAFGDTVFLTPEAGRMHAFPARP